MCEEYLFPASVEEAVAMLAQWEGQACLIAGGTDLVLEFNEGKRRFVVDCLVDINPYPRVEGDHSGGRHRHRWGSGHFSLVGRLAAHPPAGDGVGRGCPHCRLASDT